MMTSIIPAPELPRGTLVPTENLSVFGRVFRLHLALLAGQATIAAMPYTLTNLLFESLRRRYWAQIRIFNEDTSRLEIILVNRASFIHRLVAWGLSELRANVALREDRVLEEIVDIKVRQILKLLPSELISRNALKAAFLSLNNRLSSYKKKCIERAYSPKMWAPISHEGVFLEFCASGESYLLCKEYKIDWRRNPRLLCHESSLVRSGAFISSELPAVDAFLVKKQQEIEMYSDHRFAFPRLCQIMLPTRRAPVELVFMSPRSAWVESPYILGIGGMKGAIHKTVDVFSGQERALTVMTFSPEEMRSKKASLFFREVGWLGELRGDPGILHLISSIECPISKDHLRRYLVFTELCDMGKLTSSISRPRFFSQADRYHVAKQLITLLADLHRKGCVHCDLKTDNLFLKHSEEFRLQVVLGDLGSMAKKTEPEWIKHAPRTWRYISPSLAKLKKEKKEFSVDIAGCPEDVWSCGIILLQLFSQQMTLPWLKKSGIPYDEMRLDEPLFIGYMAALPKISLEGIYLGNPEVLMPHGGAASFLEAEPSSLDRALRHLIENMLEVDASKRITMREACRFYHEHIHPFVLAGHLSD